MNNDHGRRFAVYSPTGVHIGLWPDGKIAAEVAAETPGNTVEELIRADHVDALLKAERGKVLREAQSMITMRIVQAAGGGENLLSPSDIYKGVEALISEDATDG